MSVKVAPLVTTGADPPIADERPSDRAVQPVIATTVKARDPASQVTHRLMTPAP
jgi:hypothetical protein